MIIQFIAVYCILSILTFFYRKNEKSIKHAEWKTIIVLWSENDFIMKKRVCFAEKISKNIKNYEIYYTWQTNKLWLSNYIFCKNTFDEAFQIRKKFGESQIILITSRLHSRRAYNTFCNFYSQDNLKLYSLDDVFCFYSPLLPIGWIFALINIVKDCIYNKYPHINTLYYLECSSCWRAYDEVLCLTWCPTCHGVLNQKSTQKRTFRQKRTLKVAKNIIDFFPLLWIKNMRDSATIFEPFSPLLTISSNFYVKVDYLFPSGSYKDRWTAFVCSKFKELGIKEIVEDSSWNAGASLALYCQKTNIRSHIFIPDTTSWIKKQQIKKTSSILHYVKWERDEARKKAIIFAKKHHFHYAGHMDNPYFIQGIKTLAYEIYLQTNWKIIQDIIIPIGSGNLILWLYLWFQDLIKNKMLLQIPKLIWIQSNRCAPIANYFTNDSKNLCFHKEWILAEGICVTNPTRKHQIIAAIKDSGGTCFTVNDQEIKNAFDKALKNGLYLDYTAAATYAWAYSYILNNKNANIIAILTWTGLKNPS